MIHMCVYKTYTYTPHLYTDKPIHQNVNYWFWGVHMFILLFFLLLFEILISWEKNTRGYHPHSLPYLSNLHVQISSLSWLTDQQLTPKARLAAGTGQGLSLPGKMGYTKCMWLKGWVRTLKQGRLKLKFWLSYFLAVWFKNLVYLCFSLFSSIKM